MCIAAVASYHIDQLPILAPVNVKQKVALRLKICGSHPPQSFHRHDVSATPKGATCLWCVSWYSTDPFCCSLNESSTKSKSKSEESQRRLRGTVKAKVPKNADPSSCQLFRIPGCH